MFVNSGVAKVGRG